MHQYKITATITKAGGSPIKWTYYSKTKLTPKECENHLSVARVVGRTVESLVKVSDFQCIPIYANDVLSKTS